MKGVTNLSPSTSRRRDVAGHGCDLFSLASESIKTSPKVGNWFSSRTLLEVWKCVVDDRK